MTGKKRKEAADLTKTGHETRKAAVIAFASGFLMYIAVILPDLFATGGILLYNGDYLQQSIPFTYKIYDHIRAGALGWDMSAGLGSDTLTSYAFYGLFSPFSLLYVPLPREILIYAIPYVTAVKYGAGTLFACLWIRRFTENAHFAVIGGMVYMFSSFTAYNAVFHFTDAIALFPLLLLAFDALCENGRRGVFALSVFLLAVTNYYFFFGQAVFLVIYFLCRYAQKDIRAVLCKLLPALAEAVTGTLMACFMLVPVAYALVNSDKATGVMALSDMLVYPDVYKYLHILQSVFSVPDGFALVTVFPETQNTYPFGMLGASVAAYLPFFSAAGVISAVFAKAKFTREKVLFAVCAVFALVPVLNQSFSAFNSAFYARWYYMPMLVGSMVSVKTLEDRISLKPGIIACGAALCGLTLCALLRDEASFMRLSTSRAVFNPMLGLINTGVAAVSLVILALSSRLKRDRDYFPKLYILSFICVYMCYGIMSFYNLTGFDVTDKRKIADMYETGQSLPACIDASDRAVTPAQPVNYQMIWGFFNPAHFNSLHDPGFSRFLEKSGMRNVNGLFSDISIKYRCLADLVSVKYYLAYASAAGNYEDMTPAGSFGQYAVYENPDYIPLGFTYDLMLSEKDFEAIEDRDEKHRAYMKYLIVPDTAELSGVGGLDVQSYSAVTDEEYKSLVQRHKEQCAHDTEITYSGISSRIELEKENIVFYSVSYNSGWSAYVDGQRTEPLCVDFGLTGVRVPAGSHEIELRYTSPLSGAGAALSAAGAALLAAWLAIPYIIHRKRKDKTKER